MTPSTLIQELVTEREAHRLTRERLEAVEGELVEAREAQSQNLTAYMAADGSRKLLEGRCVELRQEIGYKAKEIAMWASRATSSEKHGLTLKAERDALKADYDECYRVKEKAYLVAMDADAAQKAAFVMVGEAKDALTRCVERAERAEAALAEAKDRAILTDANMKEYARGLVESLREKEEQVKAMSGLLEVARPIVCNAMCESTWPSIRQRVHSPECVAVVAALTAKPQEKP